MPKKISINVFDPESWEQAQKELKDLSEWIDERTELLVKLLASDGVEVASANFENAMYAGTNDVKVTSQIDKTEKGYKATILAKGEAVGFIEFGTGILNPMPSPEAMEDYETVIPAHGTYGEGKGMNPKGWIYHGERGNSSPYYTVPLKNGFKRTIGNLANSSMHNAYVEVQKRIEERVKEAFKYDR